MNYLVIYNIEGEICEPELTSARSIFNKMDMSDCYDISIESLYAVIGADVHKCEFHGTWSNPKDPLCMDIMDLETGEIYDIGYGTDH